MKIHIAQKGDTLWSIAKKYNITFEKLEQSNAQLSNPDAIYPGMKIKVPVERVPVTSKQERSEAPAAFATEAEAQQEGTFTSAEEVANNGESEEALAADDALLVRSAESSATKTIVGVPPIPNQPVNIEDATLPSIPNQPVNIENTELPPAPSYSAIPKPPFALPVAPPPPIVNTKPASAAGNHILQKQVEQPLPQFQPQFQAPVQQQEGVSPQTLSFTSTQKQSYTSGAQATYEQPVAPQQQSQGYQQLPSQGVLPGVPEGYQQLPPQGAFPGVPEGYQQLPPQGAFPGVPGWYPQLPPQGAFYGAPEGYPPPYFGGYQGEPCGCGGAVHQDFHQYNPYIQGAPYGYQGSPYGWPPSPYEYGAAPIGPHGYGYGPAIPTRAYGYYEPPTPAGFQQFSQPYDDSQGVEAATPQEPLAQEPIPAYPFPTATFQGQGYPDYYRDEANQNFGVPPIDEED